MKVKAKYCKTGKILVLGCKVMLRCYVHEYRGWFQIYYLKLW